MKDTNPFGFSISNTFSGDIYNQLEEDFSLEPQENYDWDVPQHVFDEKNIFGDEINQDYPMFYFVQQEKEKNNLNFKPQENKHFKDDFAKACGVKLSDVQSEPGIKIVEEKEAKDDKENLNKKVIDSNEKSDNSSHRRFSTDNEDSLSDSRSKENEGTAPQTSNVQTVEKEGIAPNTLIVPTEVKEPKMEVSKPEEDEDQKPDNDPDFCYKAPRKQKFEYNKRKDVILKTILRKCRRVLQDEFNQMTGYFSKRKMQGHQFLKDCIQQFHDSIPNKPESLDLLFYLGAILYPQEMSRGVDCFFECDKKERVKQRKYYRAKIQKVHDVLYRYSHEKMDYFVNVKELSYLYSIFYKKTDAHKDEDQYYMNGVIEIFERCKDTLLASDISV